MTLAQLAALCDFEKSNMARIEKGNTNPTYKTLYKISKALSISIKDLVNIDQSNSNVKKDSRFRGNDFDIFYHATNIVA